MTKYTKETLGQMVLSQHVDDRLTLAREGYCLEILALDKNPKVRIEVAKKGFISDALLHDDNLQVRLALATQGLGLDVFIRDPSSKLKCEMIRRGYCLDVFLKDPSTTVRKAVAEVGYGLDTLIHDEKELVRMAVANQGYGLGALIYDESIKVRESVAMQGYGLDFLILDNSRDVTTAVDVFLSRLRISIDEWVEQNPDKCVCDYSSVHNIEGIRNETLGSYFHFTSYVPSITLDELYHEFHLSFPVICLLERARVLSFRDLLNVSGTDLSRNPYLKQLGIATKREIFDLIVNIRDGYFDKTLDKIESAYLYDSYTVNERLCLTDPHSCDYLSIIDPLLSDKHKSYKRK